MFRSFVGLVLLAVLVGDGLALVALGITMFRNRHVSRSFQFLSLLFFSFALFLLIWLTASSMVPQEDRSPEYRWMMLAALTVLAAGVWPATLHFVFGQWLNGHKSLAEKASDPLETE